MRMTIIALASVLAAACTTATAHETAEHPTDPAVAHANALAGDGSPYRQRFSGSGDDRIHYVEAGEGPVIVFVHGFPSFWYVWRDQMERFRHCRRVIAIDAPGAGLSGKPADTSAYRVERLAARLDSFIAEVAGDEKVVLVGHDWGGALAWSYAEWKSDRLDRLAVFSAPPYDLILEMLANDPEQRKRSDYMQRLATLTPEAIEATDMPASLYTFAYQRLVDRGLLSPAEGELFRTALARPGALMGGAQWYRANVPPFDQISPARDAWPAVGAKAELPVLLVRGNDDRVFVDHMQEGAVDHAATLEVVRLEGVGHNTPFERPDEAGDALARFLGIAEGECRPVK